MHIFILAALVDVQRLAAQEEDMNGYLVDIKRIFKVRLSDALVIKVWHIYLYQSCLNHFDYDEIRCKFSINHA